MIARLGLQGPRGAARRLAVRRLEAAARARRLHAAEPAAAAARRADRRRRSRRRGASSGTRSTRSPAQGLTVLVSTHYMDEAERCHEIAYIAYGELLAHGTVDEVIAQFELVDLHGDAATTCTSSPHELAGKPGVDMVAPFGTSLHVSGRDAGGARGRDRALSRRRRRCTGTHSRALARGRVHRSDGPRARTISNERAVQRIALVARLLARTARDADQGVHPASRATASRSP